MQRLNKTLVYLSGPMENVVDGGTNWRNMISKELKHMGCY